MHTFEKTVHIEMYYSDDFKSAKIDKFLDPNPNFLQIFASLVQLVQLDYNLQIKTI